MQRVVAGLMVFLLLLAGGLILTDGGMAHTWGVGQGRLVAFSYRDSGAWLVLFAGDLSIPLSVAVAELKHEEDVIYLVQGKHSVPLHLVITLPILRKA